MAFTEVRDFELSPELRAGEEIANQGRNEEFHIIRIHAPDGDTHFSLDGYKMKEGSEAPFFVTRWATTLDAEAAARLFDDANNINEFEAHKGTFIVLTNNETNHYEWVNGDLDDSTPFEDLKLHQATLVRLEIEKGNPVTLVWTNAREDQSQNRFGIIAEGGFNEPWWHSLLEKTASQSSRELAVRNIGALSTGLTTFFEAPYGEQVLGNRITAQV